MPSIAAKPRVTSLAPQFLVDDLQRAIAYYRDALGFTFGQPWGGFYAIGRLDGVGRGKGDIQNIPACGAIRSRQPRIFWMSPFWSARDLRFPSHSAARPMQRQKNGTSRINGTAQRARLPGRMFWMFPFSFLCV